MDKIFGVDISRHNGTFDFVQAKKKDVQFVIIKGGGGDDGLYTDAKFSDNYNAAKAVGLDVGSYWFSKALTVADAVAEADYFYKNCLAERKFELPVYIDVENRAQLAIGRRALTDVIKAFCNRLEGCGFWVGIYSSKSYFDTYVFDSELTRYAHWVAQWSNACSYAGCGMWQFGGETNVIRSNKVAGVICDQDYMLVDYPALIKAAGKNGYSSAPQKQGYSGLFPSLPLRGYFKLGDKGGNVKLLQAYLNWYGRYGLTVDGIFGQNTLSAVTAFQRAVGLTIDGLFGAKSLAAAKAAKK